MSSWAYFSLNEKLILIFVVKFLLIWRLISRSTIDDEDNDIS